MFGLSTPSTTLVSFLLISITSIGFQNILLRRWPFHLNALRNGFTCEPPQYTSRVVSYDPLIIYLKNLITPNEREYLIKLAHAHFERSLVVSGDQDNGHESLDRTSFTASIPTDNSVALCLAERASGFQGFTPVERLEGLQVVRYEQGQEFKAHFDWGFRNERETTIFGILQADCEHCGTQFPNLSVDWSVEDKRWCEVVECEDTKMLTFKAIAGSAVFWRNVHVNGTGDYRTWHAGLPVSKGMKFGLNIWTRVDSYND